MIRLRCANGCEFLWSGDPPKVCPGCGESDTEFKEVKLIKDLGPLAHPSIVEVLLPWLDRGSLINLACLSRDFERIYSPQRSHAKSFVFRTCVCFGEFSEIQMLLGLAIEKAREQRRRKKYELDEILIRDFEEVRPEDKEQELKIYKIIFDHEQGLLKVNREYTRDAFGLVSTLCLKKKVAFDLVLTRRNCLQVTCITSDETVSVIGEFLCDDERFVLKSSNDGVYVKIGSDREFVKDRLGNFVQRYISRAIAITDLFSLADDPEEGTLIPALEFDEPVTDKEKIEYKEFGVVDKVPHFLKMTSQIRGHAKRGSSATTTKHAATSTSRSTYVSPYGTITIDLALMDPQYFTDTHTERAVSQIFRVDDLSKIRFEPNRKKESNLIKAARDAYRAREVVLVKPPRKALLFGPSEGSTAGILIMGLTNSCSEKSLQRLLDRWWSRKSYIEVITDSTRTIRTMTRRCAIVYFEVSNQDQTILEVIETIQLCVEEIASCKGACEMAMVTRDLVRERIEAITSKRDLLLGKKPKLKKVELKSEEPKKDEPLSEEQKLELKEYAASLRSLKEEEELLTQVIKDYEAKLVFGLVFDTVVIAIPKGILALPPPHEQKF